MHKVHTQVSYRKCIARPLYVSLCPPKVKTFKTFTRTLPYRSFLLKDLWRKFEVWKDWINFLTFLGVQVSSNESEICTSIYFFLTQIHRRNMFEATKPSGRWHVSFKLGNYNLEYMIDIVTDNNPSQLKLHFEDIPTKCNICHSDQLKVVLNLFRPQKTPYLKPFAICLLPSNKWSKCSAK